jgi:serine/threonine protein kinase
MSYCLNPLCPKPQNTNDGKFCLTCGSKLLLKERYRGIKPIGQGGFGRTFLAIDEDKPSKPYCVIKQFYPQAQGTSTIQKAVELFNQEAMRLDELGEHPQIPDLLAYFTQDDRQYLIQEFIEGQNLAQELGNNGVFNEGQIRQILNELLSILQFCHAKQVIHRDIKPENIIWRRNNFASNNTLVLVDFGASKVATNTALNRTGTSIGSPEYVAPEQIRGKALFASDIFSLGVTCLHLLTGKSPFDLHDANTDTWIWRQYLQNQNPVSAELEKVLNHMTESIPAKRYQKADDVIRDLNQLTQISVKPNSQSQAVKPVQVLPNKPTNQPINLVEQELEEMKTAFLTGGNKNTPTPPSQSPTALPVNKSKIDEELEEMRSKFLGN